MAHYVRNKASALVVQDDAILLVEFHDENGLHYNLPGGGMESGESLVDTVRREVKEETEAEVDVGPIVLVYEYEPVRNGFIYGSVPSVGVIFRCTLKEGATARMPNRPDGDQVGVKWMPLAQLKKVKLYPDVADELLALARGGILNRNYFEEQMLLGRSAKENG